MSFNAVVKWITLVVIAVAVRGRSPASQHVRCLRQYQHGVYFLERGYDDGVTVMQTIWRLDPDSGAVSSVFSTATSIVSYIFIDSNTALIKLGNTFGSSRLVCYQMDSDTWRETWRDSGYDPLLHENNATVYWCIAPETGTSRRMAGASGSDRNK